MFVQVSPQVDTREGVTSRETAEGTVREKWVIREQICGFVVAGEFFATKFPLRLRDDEPPLRPGRYSVRGTIVYRPYDRETRRSDCLAIERPQLEMLTKAQERAADAFLSAFSFVAPDEIKAAE